MEFGTKRRRKVALAASSTALLLLFVSVLKRVRRQRNGPENTSENGPARRLGGRRRGIPCEQQQQPCPLLWEQIQQRDWLFGLPPQIADSILARLEVPDLKALRLTCRQTYLQVAARTTKLVLALDVSPRTWRLAAPRLDSIYPCLKELHLILASEREEQPPLLEPASPAAVSAAAAAAAAGGRAGSLSPAGPGPGSAALAAAAAAGGGSPRGRGGWLSPRWGSAGSGAAGSAALLPTSASPAAGSRCGSGSGGGGGGNGWWGSFSAAAAGTSAAAATGPESLRDFLSWSACGHLAGLALLDLSRCACVPLHRDTWAALVRALGPGEVTLRVPWRCLLAHGSGSSSSGGSGSGSGSGRGSGRGRGEGSGGSAAASAKAAAATAGALTSPLSLPGDGAVAPPVPLVQPPRCLCSLCGPSPPDASPVLAALGVLGQLRPAAAVELVGRGLPLRSPAALQQLCSVSQLASVSLALCAVRPLAHHAGWLSCLRRLHSLELRYREEPGGGGGGGAAGADGGGGAGGAGGGPSGSALSQILRALQEPVPLRSLTLSRSSQPGTPAAPLLLGEPELAALAGLPRLRELDVPGLRIHGPTRLALPGVTRLALRSERLELAQPLAAVFPGLEALELGVGVSELPPTAVLAEAAAASAAAAHGAAGRHAAAAAAQVAAVDGGDAGGAAAVAAWQAEVEVADFPVVALPPPLPLPAPPQHQHGAPHHGLPPLHLGLPGELTLHLRLLQGLTGLRVLSIGGKPGHGVEALSSLTALTSLIFVRCSEFRPLRKAVEELRCLPGLRSVELHACLGGHSCGYEIARLLRRLQKLPGLSRLVLHGVDPRLPQQLATAPLGRLADLCLFGLPELQHLDLRYVLQAQTALRRLAVGGCGRLERRTVEGLAAVHRPAMALEWAP